MRKGERFKTALKRLMKIRGIKNFSELAKRSGLSRACICQYTKGRRGAPYARLALAKALNIPECLITWFALVEGPNLDSSKVVIKIEKIMWQFIEKLEKNKSPSKI